MPGRPNRRCVNPFHCAAERMIDGAQTARLGRWRYAKMLISLGIEVRFLRTTEFGHLADRSFLRLRGPFAKLTCSSSTTSVALLSSKVGSEPLFDVISTECERTSLIVTTNLHFES